MTVKTNYSDLAYPRIVWVLTPSFKPKEVTVVKPYVAFGGTYYGDEAESGKLYGPSQMFDTKAAAIASGREQLDKQQATIDKQLVSIGKRRDALDKAEGEA